MVFRKVQLLNISRKILFRKPEVAFPVVVTLASSRMAETQVATEEEKEKTISFLEKLISSEGKIGARAAAAAAAWACKESATRRRRELEDRD